MSLPRSTTIVALALLTLGAKPAPDSERVLNVEAGELVTATVNGRPMKLIVDYFGGDGIVLNPASAARAGLRWLEIGGPFAMQGGGAWDVRVVIGDVKMSSRIYWYERNVVNGDADGIIGAQLLPEKRVTLRLHAPAPGERTIELPVDNYAYHQVKLGGETVHINFTPYYPFSVATAAAGAHLATIQDGHWIGESRPVIVHYGVARPGRPMALRRPLDLNSLQIKEFVVSTADFLGGFKLPADAKADPDSIVVTGKRKKGRSVAQLWLFLGKDALSGCSSITLDKKRKMMTLRCL